MNRITITGIAATDGTVEIVTRNHDGQHAAITLTPGQAATQANAIATAAVDAGAGEPAIALRNIYFGDEISGTVTNSRNARLDWSRAGYTHRIVISDDRVREIADLLHDLADRLEDK